VASHGAGAAYKGLQIVVEKDGVAPPM
jgi:hypothetical protein